MTILHAHNNARTWEYFDMANEKARFEVAGAIFSENVYYFHNASIKFLYGSDFTYDVVISQSHDVDDISDDDRTTSCAYIIAYERDPYGKGTIVRQGQVQAPTVDGALFWLNEELKVDVGIAIKDNQMAVGSIVQGRLLKTPEGA